MYRLWIMCRSVPCKRNCRSIITARYRIKQRTPNGCSFFCPQRGLFYSSLSPLLSILSRFANLVYCGSHANSTVPIGPFLCLAMITSKAGLTSGGSLGWTAGLTAQYNHKFMGYRLGAFYETGKAYFPDQSNLFSSKLTYRQEAVEVPLPYPAPDLT